MWGLINCQCQFLPSPPIPHQWKCNHLLHHLPVWLNHYLWILYPPRINPPKEFSLQLSCQKSCHRSIQRILQGSQLVLLMARFCYRKGRGSDFQCACRQTGGSSTNGYTSADNKIWSMLHSLGPVTIRVIMVPELWEMRLQGTVYFTGKRKK